MACVWFCRDITCNHAGNIHTYDNCNDCQWPINNVFSMARLCQTVENIFLAQKKRLTFCYVTNFFAPLKISGHGVCPTDPKFARLTFIFKGHVEIVIKFLAVLSLLTCGCIFLSTKRRTLRVGPKCLCGQATSQAQFVWQKRNFT